MKSRCIGRDIFSKARFLKVGSRKFMLLWNFLWFGGGIHEPSPNSTIKTNKYFDYCKFFSLRKRGVFVEYKSVLFQIPVPFH